MDSSLPRGLGWWIYRYVPSMGENIPVTVDEAVKKLRRNRSGGDAGDASRAPERVARSVQKGKAGGRERRVEDGGRGGGGGTTLGETSGTCTDGVSGGRAG